MTFDSGVTAGRGRRPAMPPRVANPRPTD